MAPSRQPIAALVSLSLLASLLTIVATTMSSQQASATVGTPAFVQKASSSATSSTTVAATFSNATTLNDLIVVAVTWKDSGSQTYTCTDSSSNTYTSGPSTRVAGDTQSIGTCYAKVTTAAASTVTVTFGASSSASGVAISEYTAVATASPLDVSATNTGTSTTSTDAETSTSATTTTNKDIIFGAFAKTSSGANTMSAGTNYALRNDQTVNSVAHALNTEDRVLTTAGSVAATATYTQSAANYAAVMLAFKPASVQTPAFVQRTVNAYNSGSSVSTITATFASNLTIGNLIVAVYTFDSGLGNTTTCSDTAGNTYTVGPKIDDVSNGQVVGSCFARAGTATKPTVSVALPGSVGYWALTINEYSGINTAAPLDVSAGRASQATAGATDSVTSNSATTTSDNDLIVGAFVDDSGSPPSVTVGTGFTNRSIGTIVYSSDWYTEDKVLATAGSTQATLTFAAAHYYAGLMLALRPAMVVNTAPSSPSSLAQYKSDGTTSLSTGAWNSSTTVVLKGTVADPDSSDTDSLCIEIISVASSFTNTESSCSSLVAQGTTATVTISGLTNGTQYHWQARTKDATGAYSSWVSYGGNSDVVTAATDVGIDATAPSSPSSVAQYKSDGTTSLSTGAWNSSTTVVLKATVSDATSTVALCVETKAVSASFTNTEDSCSSAVASGSTTSVTVSSLSNATQYHWQARAKDAAGNYSSWTSYGGNSDVVTAATDFGVDTTSPTTGTVYDGSIDGSESKYNSGALSSLSANWSGFGDAGGSALTSYTYSIGTSAGATDVLSAQSTASTSFTASSLSLRTGQRYYVNVQAIDGAGNVSSTTSSPGQYVAPSLTFSLSATTIDLGHLNVANSYTSTQALNVTTSTNGYSGYVVRQYSPSSLVSAGRTIAAYPSSYASPTTWSGTGFGYTSSDTSIQASGNLFAGATKFAALASSAPGDVVADHTATVSGTSISNETFTLTYKVKVAASQSSARYTAPIVISVQAIF